MCVSISNGEIQGYGMFQVCIEVRCLPPRVSISLGASMIAYWNMK